MRRFFINEKNKTGQYLRIITGTFMMSVAVVNYFDRLDVVTGGVTGIAIMLNRLAGMPMWLVNGLINIPLFIAGWKILDRLTFIRTLIATIALTFFLGVVPVLDIRTDEMLVDIIIGATLMGVGLGLIFISYASSGGTDLAATLINVKVRHISIPKIMAIIDGVIILAGAGVFGIKNGIYALIAIYTITKVSDSIVEGPNRAKIMYIITNQYESVLHYIINDIERGVTLINTTGAFSKTDKQMIMTVVSGRQMVKIKQNVYQTDENAICFVGDIREAFGEGFTKFRG